MIIPRPVTIILLQYLNQIEPLAIILLYLKLAHKPLKIRIVGQYGVLSGAANLPSQFYKYRIGPDILIIELQFSCETDRLRTGKPHLHLDFAVLNADRLAIHVVD